MTISMRGWVVIAVCLTACSDDEGSAKDSGSPRPDGSVDAASPRDAAADAGQLSWYETCGDPVCRIGQPHDSGVPACDAGQNIKLPCDTPGAQCDPGSECGVLLRCTDSDPTMRPGGCPISRAAYKVDIQYLAPQELQRYHDQVMGLGLAHYRYRDDPSAQERLGFIIEDVEPSRFVDEARDRVDMYAYTSALVAAMQIQEQRIGQLERELAELRGTPQRGGQRRASVPRGLSPKRAR